MSGARLHRLVRSSGALGVVLGACVASSTAAGDPARPGDDYVAPEECPDAEAFAAELRSRTPAGGRPPPRGPVRLARDAGGFTGSVTIEGEGAPRTVRGARCDDVVRALAVVLSAATEPEASPPRGDYEDAYVPRRSMLDDLADDLEDPPSDRSPPPSWWFSGGVALGLVGGVGPTLAPELAPYLAVERGGLKARVAASWSRTMTTERGPVSLAFERWAVAADVCPLAIAIVSSVRLAPVCVGAQLGSTSSAAERSLATDAEVEGGARVWLAGRASLGLAWTASRTVAIGAEARAVAPLRRVRYVAGADTLLYATPPIAAEFGLSAELRFSK